MYFKVADGFKAGGFNAESSNPFAASTPYALKQFNLQRLDLREDI